MGVALLVAAIGLLLLVGVSGPSVASPPLGDRGWAPPALPWRLAPWVVVAVQTLAYALGAASLLRHLRAPCPLRLRWWQLAGLAVLVLLTAPFGTADHTNYAAYGRMLVEGVDPWVTAPQDLGGDPVAALVQPPWRDEPSVYGPVGTWLMGLAGVLGGDSMRQVVWVWQVLVVGAWLGVRTLLVRLAGAGSAPLVDRWWTTNVLVLGAGVLGAHLDTLALAGLVAALALGLAGRPLLAGLVTGVAASTKITAGVVGLALVVGWLAAGATGGPGGSGTSWRDRLRPAVRPSAWLVLGALVVLVPTHLLAGPAVLSQVAGSGGGVSYATPWRAVYTVLDLGLPEPVARSLAVWVAAAWCVVLALLLWRVTAALEAWPAVRALLVLTAAYALGSAYVLPWYELMQWGAVALALGLLAAAPWAGATTRASVALRALVAVLVLRGVVLAIGYVPGRVLLPDDVETVTLGFRFVASPLATVAAWTAVVALWRRSARSGVTVY